MKQKVDDRDKVLLNLAFCLENLENLGKMLIFLKISYYLYRYRNLGYKLSSFRKRTKATADL